MEPHFNLLQPACLVLEGEDDEGDEDDVEPGKEGGEEEGDRPAEEEQGGGQAQRLHIMVEDHDKNGVNF